MKFVRLPALALCAVLAGAAAVQAQDASAPPPAGAPGGHHGWDPAQFRARMEAHRAERLKALHDVLGIRPEQESAFQAWADSMKLPQRPEGAGPQHQPGEFAGLTTPERLDRMAQRMQERTARRQAAFARRAAATKTFYAALNPSQQKAFDSLSLLRGDDRHGGWGHGRGGFGRHGFGDNDQG